MHDHLCPGRIRNFNFLILFVLFFTLILSCHGDGGRRTVPSVTTLTVGVPRANDAVVFRQFRPYSAPSTPGQLYKISITERTDIAVLTYYGTDSSFSSIAGCSIDNTNLAETTSEDCIVAAPGSVLYFSVDGDSLAGSSASYTIAVEALAITNLNMSIPLPDTVSRTSARVYEVPSTVGTSYTVAITGLDNDSDLYVFDDICSPDNTLFFDTISEDCTLTAGAASLFFIVDPIFSSAPIARFTALATPAAVAAQPADQGSPGAPVPVQLDNPFQGEVAAAPGGISHYSVSGLISGTRYTVSSLGLTGDVDLDVYGSDGTFTNPAACQIDNTFFADPPLTPESCTLTVTGSTLYFSVIGRVTTGGAAFINLVEPGP